MKFAIYLGCLLFSVGVGATNLNDVRGKWLNTNGETVSLEKAAEQSHYIITMVYTGCAHACPMTISKMQSILKEFEKNKIKNIKAVLVSFDFKNDRPEVLKKYQEGRKLDFSTWKFLAGESEKNLRELAVVLGISYKPIANGDFSHSNIISLVNSSGQVVASINSLNADINDMVKAAKEIK